MGTGGRELELAVERLVDWELLEADVVFSLFGLFFFAVPTPMTVTQTATTTSSESAMESVRFSCNFF
jgi:hypothetical protein